MTQVLDRDVLVLEPLGLPLGGVEQPGQPLGDEHLAGCRARAADPRAGGPARPRARPAAGPGRRRPAASSRGTSPSGWSSRASSRCSPSTSVWPKRSALVCASCSASCDFWVRRFRSTIGLRSRRAVRAAKRRLELGDPVEQVDHEAEGGVVEGEARRAAAGPGHARRAGPARTTARRRRRGRGSSRPSATRRRTSSGCRPAGAGERVEVEAGRGPAPASDERVASSPPPRVERRDASASSSNSRRSSSVSVRRHHDPDLGVQVAGLRRAGWAGRGRAAAAAARSTCPAAPSPWPRRRACRRRPRRRAPPPTAPAAGRR